MHDAVEQFNQAIRSHCLEPPEQIIPGKFHRIPGVGKGRSNKAGYCKLFEDLQGGIIGDFSSDFHVTWHMKQERPYSREERAAFARQGEIARRQSNRRQVEAKKQAQKRAQEIWEQATPAVTTHPYLMRKGVKPHGIRQTANSLLVIPMAINHTIQSLQYITPDGQKRFLKDGQTQGCYHILGNLNSSQPLCIAEGFATAASIHQATEYPVAIAFTAGNLLFAGLNLRKLFPHLQLVFCADNDLDTPGNPGVTKAIAAAKIVGGVVVMPNRSDK